MRILALKDDKPGHYHQSEAVVMALSRLEGDIGPISVEWLEIPKRLWLPQKILHQLIVRRMLPRFILERVVGNNLLEPSQAPDLVLSAGGKTLPHLLLLSQRYHCKSIFSGSIRNIPADRFTAILHIFKSYERYPNAIVTLKPSPVDPKAMLADSAGGNLPFAGKAFRAMMVGGPTKSRQFSESDWGAILKWLQTRLETENWVVVSSRRTPAIWNKSLAKLAAQFRDTLCFLDYTKTRPGEAISIMVRAEANYVTSDSDSMTTEAVACRKPVVSILPARSNISEDIGDYIKAMVDSGWLIEISSEALNKMATRDEEARVACMPEDHLDSLAHKLKNFI